MRQRFERYVKDEVTMCGVWYSNQGYLHTARRNAEARQGIAARKVDKLSRLNLTMHGKVLLINSIVHSQFFYIICVYMPPVDILKSIRRITFQFLWNNGREVIKRNIIENNKDKGGLELAKISEKCESMFIDHNIQPVCQESFSHQRQSLFKYFFASKIRKLYNHMYSNNMPHCFSLRGAYKSAE